MLFFSHPGPKGQLSGFCLLFVEPNKRWAGGGYGAGDVFSVCKALDPGFSVMATEEILPQISYRTPAAVRQGKEPEFPANNSNRHRVLLLSAELPTQSILFLFLLKPERSL